MWHGGVVAGSPRLLIEAAIANTAVQPAQDSTTAGNGESAAWPGFDPAEPADTNTGERTNTQRAARSRGKASRAPVGGIANDGVPF